MSIRYTEKPRSQKAVVDFKNPTSQHAYSVWGSTDKNEILLFVASIMPPFDTTIDATTGDVIQLFPLKVDADEFDIGYWDIVVHYANSSDTVDVTLSLGVQSFKIFESLAVAAVYACDPSVSSQDLLDYAASNTIGETEEEVQGCEIEVGKVEFCITRKWQTGSLDPDYVKLLMDLTDRTAVNDDTFTFTWLDQDFEFDKGTIRLRGAPMKWNGTGELEISYHFAYQRSIVTDDHFNIGTATDIVKEGWHYGEVRYKAEVLNGKKIMTPLIYKVHQVYPYADFQDLDLT